MSNGSIDRSSASLENTPVHRETPPTTTASDHLSFPSASTPEPAPQPSTSSQPKQLLKDRLYVGNLHPTVDEFVFLEARHSQRTADTHHPRYTLLQVFQKYGKISKMDFLFHKTGPMKGKPRGYAFVEYSDHAVCRSFIFQRAGRFSYPMVLPPFARHTHVSTCRTVFDEFTDGLGNLACRCFDRSGDVK